MMKLGRFDIDLGMRRLRLDGQSVRLGSRAFDILAVIVSANGRLVTRDELMKAVWPGIIVEEALFQKISLLRKRSPKQKSHGKEKQSQNADAVST